MKVFANVLSGIGEVIKAFLGKLLYFLIMIVGASSLCRSVVPQVDANELFLLLLIVAYGPPLFGMCGVLCCGVCADLSAGTEDIQYSTEILSSC